MHQPSPAVRVLLDRLLQLPLLHPDTLRERLDAHLVKVDLAEGADLGLAHAVAEACRALLDSWPNLDGSGRLHVQAACLYVVQQADVEDDLDLIGFEDDAEAVAWVASHVGRPEVHERLLAAWR